MTRSSELAILSTLLHVRSEALLPVWYHCRHLAVCCRFHLGCFG